MDLPSSPHYRVVLRMAATPITIYVDSLAVVQGSAAGRHVTVSAKNLAADLWDTIRIRKGISK